MIMPVARRPVPARLLFAIVVTVAVAAATAVPRAQPAAKKALTVADYSRWHTIGGQELSGDGKWVTYTLRQANVPTIDEKPVLHVLNLATNQEVSVANASGGAFSADAKWIAYLVEPPAAGRGRGGRGRGGNAVPTPAPETAAPAAPGQGRGPAPPPEPPRHAELRNLATGAVQSWQDIQSFVFSPASTHLVLKRRATNGAAGAGGRGTAAAAPAGNAGAEAAPAPPRGTDVVLVDLQSGRSQLLAAVGDIVFNKKGDLLAFDVDGPVKEANGVFVFDTHSGRITALDNDARMYNRLAWSEDGNALAVLKGAEVEHKREHANVLMAYHDISAAVGRDDAAPKPAIFDPQHADGFPAGFVVSERAPLAWSADDARVFFGMKEQADAPAAERHDIDEAADVDVWNSADERIQSVQMTRAEQDRNFTYREAFDTSANRFVKLADETMRDIDIAADGRWAVGRDTRGHVSDYKPASADLYRVNTTTGERTLLAKNQLIATSTGPHTFGISPDGKSFLYWKDNKFQDYDLDHASTKALGGANAPSFVDTDFDHPGPKPAFGLAGFTKDGAAVIVEHKYDLWALPLDGSAARNLTNGAGAKAEMRLRYLKTDPPDPPTAPAAAPGGNAAGGGGRGRGAGRDQGIDLSKPITLSAYGEWTKKAGFYELANGQLHELVYEDAYFSTPVKAAAADTMLFTRETETEFPDLRVSGPTFKDARKITDANPQQSEYLWGHRMLIDFKDHDGHRLQALLTIPDDYKAGEKRPMLVNFYEKNSQNLHRYNAPSYLASMGSSPMQAVSDGYLALVPDVYFHTGSSHSDMLDSVEAATRKVIEMGYVDPKKIGINGHSYGGEGVAFIGTRSRLFAAVGMGAGVTDLYQDFNQNWGWSYQIPGGNGGGGNGTDYYLYSQGRWGFSPWEKPDVYMFESALTHVPEITAPFLIMHGTADPTVSFTNGLGFYNAMRFNGKNAILLAYLNEGHGLRGMANRKDLTIRYFQFFDHYLKGAPAPKWMTDGVPYLRRGEDPDGSSPR